MMIVMTITIYVKLAELLPFCRKWNFWKTKFCAVLVSFCLKKLNYKNPKSVLDIRSVVSSKSESSIDSLSGHRLGRLLARQSSVLSWIIIAANMAAPPLPPPPTQTATSLARSYDSKTGPRRNFIERDNVKHNLDGEELTRRFYLIMKKL